MRRRPGVGGLNVPERQAALVGLLEAAELPEACYERSSNLACRSARAAASTRAPTAEATNKDVRQARICRSYGGNRVVEDDLQKTPRRPWQATARAITTVCAADGVQAADLAQEQ